MTDETVKLETFEQVQEAIAVIASEVVRLAEVQQAQGKVIEAQGKLIMGMDHRIRLIMRLVDNLHRVLEAHGWVPPLPTGGMDVN